MWDPGSGVAGSSDPGSRFRGFWETEIQDFLKSAMHRSFLIKMGVMSWRIAFIQAILSFGLMVSLRENEMKKNYRVLLGSLLSLVLPTTALAQYDDEQDNSDGDYGNSYYQENDEGYESSFGNRYEYDLSDPGDRIMYEVDPDAQLRDSLDVNPERDLERSLGEYGGGILDD